MKRKHMHLGRILPLLFPATVDLSNYEMENSMQLLIKRSVKSRTRKARKSKLFAHLKEQCLLLHHMILVCKVMMQGNERSSRDANKASTCMNCLPYIMLPELLGRCKSVT